MEVEDRVDLEGGGAVPWRSSRVVGEGKQTKEEEEVIVY